MQCMLMILKSWYYYVTTRKAEQLGSRHPKEAKTCHKDELTLEEKNPAFLCLLIFKNFKSQSCTDTFEAAEVN